MIFDITTPFCVQQNVVMHCYFGGMNMTGSIKDLLPRHLIDDAEKIGLTKEHTIVDVSSGNYACALAFACMRRGYRCHVVVNENISRAKQNILDSINWSSNGSFTYTVKGKRTIDSRDYLMTNIMTSQNRVWFLDQLHNEENPTAYVSLVKKWVMYDWVVGSMGSGGSLLGIHSMNNQGLITVESDKGTRIAGCGTFCDGDYETPFVTRLRHLAHHQEKVNWYEAEVGMRKLHNLGVYCGLQGGAVYSAAIKVLEEYPKVSGHMMLIIGDHAYKNL